MECKINDDLESVDKNYRQQLEKAYKAFMYLSARCFDTKRAKKEIKNICGCMVEMKEILDKYELENEIEHLNKDSAQYDCELYIKENELEYIAPEIRAAYKKGFHFKQAQKDTAEASE